MLKKFLPDEHVESIFDIRPNKLKSLGIKGVITDLDNTLVEWDRPDATPELLKWVSLMKDQGIFITVVSNNTRERVSRFSDPVELPFIYKARKPMTKAFRQAMNDMQLKKDEIVIVGDQILTDVFGGNRLGVHTILVVPIARNDGWMTKLNRKMEHFLLAWMKRRGMIFWEE
ncbi:MAG TPA: YqeG family HAD IIIA-type phosphatase [Bacillales bacterium]|nr:YqeG family HAD IIIA-type phosphatase [Bacillales bacterium]